MDDDERIERTLMASMAVPERCLLCGVATFSRGVFTPKDSEEFGGSKDKQRVVIYALCERHEFGVETAECVEMVAKQRLVGVSR